MRRRTPFLTLLALLVALAAAPTAAEARDCGSVSFIANSDSGAFDIRARAIGCRAARKIARASRDVQRSGGPGSAYRYRARGFDCVGRDQDTQLASVRFRCRREGALVTFNRT